MWYILDGYTEEVLATAKTRRERLLKTQELIETTGHRSFIIEWREGEDAD